LSSLIECKREFDEWVKKHGYGNADFTIRQWRKQRVDPERDDRDKTSPAQKQKMFNAQKGFCPICKKLLFIPATDHRNEVDHIDVNREDYNHRTNKQLVHGNPCNRNKSSKSIVQISKETGIPFDQIIGAGYRKWKKQS
jgi:hypothetical protein